MEFILRCRCKFKCQFNKKLISSVIGGILFHLASGSVLPLGNFSIYIVSYHKIKETFLTVNYGFFFLPILLLGLTSFVSVGGMIEEKFGVHV